MPTTLPSPVDRAEFQFVAVDATGAIWEWLDHEMVWVRVAEEAGSTAAARDGCTTVH